MFWKIIESTVYFTDIFVCFQSVILNDLLLQSPKLDKSVVASIMCLNHIISLFQESISDFYWYYSGKDVIDEQGQRNFSKAIQVAKQVFNTLTEYIQVNIINVCYLKKEREKKGQLVGIEFLGKMQYA